MARSSPQKLTPPPRHRGSQISPPSSPYAQRSTYGPGRGTARWEAKHDALLVVGVIRQINQNRPALYTLEGILGEVDNNGNDRTGKHLTRILEDLARRYGVDPSIVKENKRSPTKSPKKRARREVTPDLETMDEEDDTPEPRASTSTALVRVERRNPPVPPDVEVHSVSDDDDDE